MDIEESWVHYVLYQLYQLVLLTAALIAAFLFYLYKTQAPLKKHQDEVEPTTLNNNTAKINAPPIVVHASSEEEEEEEEPVTLMAPTRRIISEVTVQRISAPTIEQQAPPVVAEIDDPLKIHARELIGTAIEQAEAKMHNGES